MGEIFICYYYIMKDPKLIYQSLFSQVHSLQLATVSSQGEPNASYAPFICDKAENLYIFVSGLAKHTQNLLDTKQASVLIIEDEQASRQLFARNRITYQCAASEVGKDDHAYNHLLDQMQERFGETLGLLRSLGDFRLIKLQPLSGQIVVGFAQTYPLPFMD